MQRYNKMIHNCFNCRYFTAYYEKAYCCFLRTNCGNCEKLSATVEKHSSCESWAGKYETGRLRKGAVLKELADVLTKINGIKLILDENEEERIRK